MPHNDQVRSGHKPLSDEEGGRDSLKRKNVPAKRWKEFIEALVGLLGSLKSPKMWFAFLKALGGVWPKSFLGRTVFILAIAALACCVVVWNPPAKMPVAVHLHDWAAAAIEDSLRWPLPKASGERFAIAVSHFEGDDDGNVEQAIAESVRNVGGIELLRFDRMLRVKRAASSSVAEARAHERARRWLTKAKADLLVWGYIAPGKKVRILLTLRNARADESIPLSIDQAMEFPVAARKFFDAAINAQVTALLAEFDAGHAVAPQLKLAIARLSALVQSQPPGELKNTLTCALANARIIQGEQTGDPEPLRAAEAALRDVIRTCPREQAAEIWAKAQHRLGRALFRLGELKAGDTTRFEEAIAAFREALSERTKEKSLSDWATIQFNLAAVLALWGRRAGITAKLDEAVTAYREVLKEERMFEEVPMVWAATQYSLGVALVWRGEIGLDVERLREAEAAYREAQRVWTRAAVPLSWATAQSSLSIALRHRGEYTGDREVLVEAVKLAQSAVDVPGLNAAPKRQESFQGSLNRARQALEAFDRAHSQQ